MHPAPKPTIPDSHIKVPAKLQLAPDEKAPSITQNTFVAEAPFINFKLAPAVVARAPGILNIKTAFGSPPPSRVIAPASVAAVAN